VFNNTDVMGLNSAERTDAKTSAKHTAKPALLLLLLEKGLKLNS